VTRPLVERELPANVHVFRRIADPLGPLPFGEQQEPEQLGAGSGATASDQARDGHASAGLDPPGEPYRERHGGQDLLIKRTPQGPKT